MGRGYFGPLACVCWAAGIWLPPASASEVCRSCHPQAIAGYLQTGMGNSIGSPSAGRSGAFEHGFSGSAFSIAGADGGMVQRVERDGLSAEYPIEYRIGSGNAAFGYLIRVGADIYQAPVAYYAKRAKWDMAPGFENHPEPDFDRPVLPECLWCHAGRPRHVPLSQNRYADPALELAAISCDRCHGDPAAHLARPSRSTIINPASLPAVERDSVCEQCHLSGEQRILNPGKSFGDFRPGMRLEEVLSVYVNDYGASSSGEFKVVSHAEQLKLSRCYGASGGRMWCGTCHDPHDKPTEPAAYYRSKCLDCHGEATLAKHAGPVDACVSCHMARRQSRDSGHSAFTDHFILRRPDAEAGTERSAAGIRPWRAAADRILAQRNLGLAYVELGRRNRRPDYLDEGASLLARLAQASSLDGAGLEALGSVLISKEAPPEAGFEDLAIQLLRDALRLNPNGASRHRTLGAAFWQTGAREQAIEHLNRAMRLDPQVRAAYQVMARLYLEVDEPAMALDTWNRYLELVPQSLAARRAVLEVKGRLLRGNP